MCHESGFETFQGRSLLFRRVIMSACHRLAGRLFHSFRPVAAKTYLRSCFKFVWAGDCLWWSSIPSFYWIRIIRAASLSPAGMMRCDHVISAEF